MNALELIDAEIARLQQARETVARLMGQTEPQATTVEAAPFRQPWVPPPKAEQAARASTKDGPLERVLRLLGQEGPVKNAARKTGVSWPTCQKILDQYAEKTPKGLILNKVGKAKLAEFA